MENVREKINLELIISLVIVMATIAGMTVPMYIHSSNQIDAIRQDMKEFHIAWSIESKDFHGRLERQDAEFKAGMLLIEERMKR